MPPESEPIPGKTYLADGWEYRDIYTLLTKEAKELLLSIIGEGNYVILAESEKIIEGVSCWYGQFLISPQGMASTRVHQQSRKN